MAPTIYRDGSAIEQSIVLDSDLESEESFDTAHEIKSPPAAANGSPKKRPVEVVDLLDDSDSPNAGNAKRPCPPRRAPVAQRPLVIADSDDDEPAIRPPPRASFAAIPPPIKPEPQRSSSFASRPPSAPKPALTPKPASFSATPSIKRERPSILPPSRTPPSIVPPIRPTPILPPNRSTPIVPPGRVPLPTEPPSKVPTPSVPKSKVSTAIVPPSKVSTQILLPSRVSTPIVPPSRVSTPGKIPSAKKSLPTPKRLSPTRNSPKKVISVSSTPKTSTPRGSPPRVETRLFPPPAPVLQERACENCRKRSFACDRMNPCGNCTDSGRNCVPLTYATNSPRKSLAASLRKLDQSLSKESNSSKVSSRQESEESIPDGPLKTAIGNTLDDFRQIISNDHANKTRDALRQAREGARKARLEADTSFLDDVSPWAGTSSAAQTGDTIWTFESYLGKNYRHSKMDVPVTKVRSEQKPPPTYRHYIPILRNLITEDTKYMEYQPYLGDQDGLPPDQRKKLQAILDELANQHDGETHEMNQTKRKQYANMFFVYVDAMLSKVGCSKAAMMHYLLEANENSSKDLSSKQKQNINNSFSQPEDDDMERAKVLCRAFEKKFHVFLAEVLPETHTSDQDSSNRATSPESRRGKTPASSQNPDIEMPEKALSTYFQLKCAICGVHQCPTHATVDESVFCVIETPYNLVVQRNAMKSPDMEVDSADIEPCSLDCWFRFRWERPNHPLRKPFRDSETTQLRALYKELGGQKDTCCHIADFMPGRTCYEIECEIRRLGLASPPNPQPSKREHFRKLDWCDLKSKRIFNFMDWENHTKTHMLTERSNPEPCAHPGFCSPENNCLCAKDNVLCDIYCPCPSTCWMKFTGCDCAGHGKLCTANENCPCQALNRECTSGLCGPCGANERADRANKYDEALHSHGCQNVAIQRGFVPHLTIGTSTRQGAGYGLFTMQDLKKGEFIGEYIGELISNEEADRRGQIYDWIHMSYLFTLNKDLVIDAGRMGNFTRFINHSKDPSVSARTMLVNGAMRIGYWVHKDVKEVRKGEELWLNYGGTFTERAPLLDDDGVVRRPGNGAGRRGGKRSGARRKKSASKVAGDGANALARTREESGSNPNSPTKRKKGRPVGSRMINGVLFTPKALGLQPNAFRSPNKDGGASGSRSRSRLENGESGRSGGMEAEEEVEEADARMQDVFDLADDEDEDEYEDDGEDEDGMRRYKKRNVARPFKYTR